MSITDVIAKFPQWTERVVVEGSGRDPLGLSRVSDVLVDRLLPSIITTTDRARYYSFYPWAISDVSNSTKGGDDEFIEEFRRREAAFAVTSKLGKKTELPIVGITQVDAKMAGLENSGELDTAFPVLPSNDLGGLGQYYLGCVSKLQIADVGTEEYLTTFEGRGEKLAAAFAASIASTPIAQLIGDAWTRIPYDILQKSANHFSLDGIREKKASAERELLIQIFLELDEDTPEESPLHRQAAIGQFLHVVANYEAHSIEFPRKAVNQYCLFWPHYYGQLCDSDGAIIPYVPQESLVADSAYWRQFCAHQFFTYATENFLQAILDALSSAPEGLTQLDLIDALLEVDFETDLEKCLGKKVSGPSDLLEFFGAMDTSPENALENRRRFSGEHVLSEWNLIHGQDDQAPSTRIAKSFAVWTQLYAKWYNSDEGALDEVLGFAGREWSLGTCFEWGDDWMEKRPVWRDALKNLLDRFLERHEEIKYQKHKLDAAWFECVGDRYLKIQDLKVQFRASRHPNMVTILQDLGLLEDGRLDDSIFLENLGKKKLQEVIRARQ